MTIVQERDRQFGNLRKSYYICKSKTTTNLNAPSPACNFPRISMGTDEKEMNMKNEPLPHLHFPKLKSVLQKAKEMLAYCTCIITGMLIAIVSHQSERSIWPSATPCSPPICSSNEPKNGAATNRVSNPAMSSHFCCRMSIPLSDSKPRGGSWGAAWLRVSSWTLVVKPSSAWPSCSFVALRGKAPIRMASSP